MAAARGTPDFPGGWEYMSIGGWLSHAQLTSYNADGTVAAQSAYGRSTATDWQRAVIMAVNYRGQTLPDEVDISPTGAGPLEVHSRTTYTGYDAAGNVSAYGYDQPYQAVTNTPAYIAHYTVSYLKKDGYLEQGTRGVPLVEGYLPATDTSRYDGLGRRLAVTQSSQSGSGVAQQITRVFAYDAGGAIVQRRDGSASGSTFTATGGYATHHYTYVNGQQVSDMDEAGGIHVLETLTAFSSGGSPQGYAVQAGDTLAGIAQSVYGNSNLGYLVASANGISQDSDLVVGQTLTIPSVTTHSNSATTFKPYNPGQLIGSTTPSLPAVPPPPPSDAGCNALAAIVVIAVTVAVAFYAGPWVAEQVGNGLLGAVVGGAAAGAAGSAAGQLAGDMLGTRSGFSFNEVLRQGLIGGLTAGSVPGEGIGSALAEGASSYVVGYGVDKLVGHAAHFSWAGLVASSVSSAVSSEFGATASQVKTGQLGSNYLGNIEARVVGDVVNREVNVGLGDHHVMSWQQIGEDVFGNALGNATVAGIKAYETNQAQQAATPAYDPNKDPLLKYAQGYQHDMAFEQSAQGVMDSSPLLLADNVAPRNPVDISNSRPMSTDSRRPSSGSDIGYSYSGDQPITWPGSGYTGILEADAYGNPYRINGLDVTDMVPMTVTATAPGNSPFDVGELSMGSLTIADLVPAKVAAITVDAAGSGLDALSKTQSNSPSPADAVTLATVTVNSDGSVRTVYSAADEAQFQQSWSNEIYDSHMQRDYQKVTAYEALASQANQQQLAMLHDLSQTTGNQAFEVMAAPAVLASAVALAPLTLPAGAVGGGALLTTGQVVNGIVGGISGYHTDGWQGSVLGASAGILSFGGSSYVALTANSILDGGSYGFIAGAAAFAGSNGIAGSLTVAATNAATGKRTLNGVGTAFVLNATSPFLSGEVVVVAIGGDTVVGAGVANAYSIYTAGINLVESFLPHPAPNPPVTPNVSGDDHK